MRTVYEVYYDSGHGHWCRYDEYETKVEAEKVALFLKGQGNRTKIVERP